MNRAFRRLRAWVGAHRRLAALLALLVAGGIAAALYWFAPWKLFVDERVDEPLPREGDEPKEIASGAFRSLEHETSGTARILEYPDGARYLRLEGLRTSNGPDLVVMLSDTPSTQDGWGAHDDGKHVILDELKGNEGSQNYEILRSVDLGDYRSAVVWCRRFSVAFGVAPIR